MYRSAVVSLCYAVLYASAQLFLHPQPGPHMYRSAVVCVMLYYMLAAQLFLQPQPEPHMYRSAVV